MKRLEGLQQVTSLPSRSSWTNKESLKTSLGCEHRAHRKCRACRGGGGRSRRLREQQRRLELSRQGGTSVNDRRERIFRVRFGRELLISNESLINPTERGSLRFVASVDKVIEFPVPKRLAA